MNKLTATLMLAAKLVTLVLMLLAELAFGQGQISFQNLGSTLISTNSVLGGPSTGLISPPRGSYYFALFSAPSGTVSRADFTFTGAYATNMSIAGAA